MCSGNSDPLREPDIQCEPPRQRPRNDGSTAWSPVWAPSGGNASLARGRNRRACCECALVPAAAQTLPMPDAFCTSTTSGDEDATTADNECTRVMRYAGCPELPECRIGSATTEAARAACQECEEAPGSGFPSWQHLSAISQAQHLCMAASQVQGCRYTFAQNPHPPPPVGCGLVSSSHWSFSLPSTYGCELRAQDEVETYRCTGNSGNVADVVCEPPSVLR